MKEFIKVTIMIDTCYNPYMESEPMSAEEVVKAELCPYLTRKKFNRKSLTEIKVGEVVDLECSEILIRLKDSE
ncbi:hypothetical protein TA3x_004261 [Tundrisphaera sp. TA3]|uniref:hypothetical protein n=1 Tax=Tundrisphaera sp. TA3 TaxID=3435775 RepID=UPI003EBF34C8